LTKSLGSDCATNIVWATLEGLKQLRRVEKIAADRGLDVAEVL
jgi:small subunit ribosomal protein S5